MEDELYQNLGSDCHSVWKLEVESEVKHKSFDVPEYCPGTSMHQKCAEIKELHWKYLVKKEECEPKHSQNCVAVAEKSKADVKQNDTIQECDFFHYNAADIKQDPDIFHWNPTDIKQESGIFLKNSDDSKKEPAESNEMLVSVEHVPASNSKKKIVDKKNKRDTHYEQLPDAQQEILPSDFEKCYESSGIFKGLQVDYGQISLIDASIVESQMVDTEENPSSRGQTIDKKTPSDERPFSCDMCQYTCKEKKSLMIHKMTHPCKKRYSCDMCSYKCHEATKLRRHKRIHTDEKPYSCNMCQFKCKYPDYLQKHQVIHTDAKPYSCDMCQYTCKRTGELKKHKNIHENEKLYSCIFICR